MYNIIPVLFRFRKSDFDEKANKKKAKAEAIKEFITFKCGLLNFISITPPGYL